MVIPVSELDKNAEIYKGKMFKVMTSTPASDFKKGTTVICVGSMGSSSYAKFREIDETTKSEREFIGAAYSGDRFDLLDGLTDEESKRLKVKKEGNKMNIKEYE